MYYMYMNMHLLFKTFNEVSHPHASQCPLRSCWVDLAAVRKVFLVNKCFRYFREITEGWVVGWFEPGLPRA